MKSIHDVLELTLFYQHEAPDDIYEMTTNPEKQPNEVRNFKDKTLLLFIGTLVT